MQCAVSIAFALMFAVCIPATHAQSAPSRKDIPTIAKAAKEAIVTIVTAVNDKPIALGTGFLVRADGVIVTNYHVIRTGNVAAVKFSDETVLPVDGVLAADKVRDLAIIKIHGKTFRTLTLGNSDQIEVGEEVVAIGNPLGLELTVSNGILSGVRTDKGGKLLQITAPITHGSSGGPLFNMMGEVVGITTLGIEGGGNLNFAIPINDANLLLSHQSAKLQNLPNEAEPDESPKKTHHETARSQTTPLDTAEKCFQQARFFSEATTPGYLDDEKSPVHGYRTFSDHYDLKTNSCYVLTFTVEYMNRSHPLNRFLDEDLLNRTSTTITVTDAFEQREVAYFQGGSIPRGASYDARTTGACHIQPRGRSMIFCEGWTNVLPTFEETVERYFGVSVP